MPKSRTVCSTPLRSLGRVGMSFLFSHAVFMATETEAQVQLRAILTVFVLAVTADVLYPTSQGQDLPPCKYGVNDSYCHVTESAAQRVCKSSHYN